MTEFTTLTLDQLYADAGNGGRCPRTKSLFYQTRQKGHTPIFTLNEYDHDGCYSFYKLYMQYADEYTAVKAILGSWKYWQVLKDVHWFKPLLEQWNEEIEIRDKAAAKATILAETEAGSVPAARALKDYYKREKIGRKTKEEVTREARIEAGVNDKVAVLADRMKGK